MKAAILITAYNRVNELAKLLDSDTSAYPIYIFLDNQNTQYVGIFRRLVEDFRYFKQKDIELITNVVKHHYSLNKIKSMMYALHHIDADFFYFLEDDITLSPDYFKALESLWGEVSVKHKPAIVSSINFGKAQDERFNNKYGEFLGFWWNFACDKYVIRELIPFFQRYRQIYTHDDLTSHEKLFQWYAELRSPDRYKRIGYDAVEVLDKPAAARCATLDGALNHFIKYIGGARFFTLTPYVKPIKTKGTYVPEEFYDEYEICDHAFVPFKGDKNWSFIEGISEEMQLTQTDFVNNI